MLIDVSALEHNRLFCCDTQQSSDMQVAQAFSDHGTTWRRGRVDTAVSCLSFNHFDIFSLQYGAEVEVRPRSNSEFVLIYFSLSGVISVESCGRSVDRRAGEAIVLGPSQDRRMRWAEGTRQLILKIPKSHLSLGDAEATTMPLDSTQSTQLRGLVQALLYAKSPTSDACVGDWLSGLERTLLAFTSELFQQRDRELTVESPVAGRLVARDRRRVDRLLEYLRSHLGAPVGLGDMARVADLSERGLHLLCQRHLGNTPMAVLRDLRLDAARDRLRHVPEAAVTDIALELGFGHLGRFARYYRARFGELPSETQRGRLH